MHDTNIHEEIDDNRAPIVLAYMATALFGFAIGIGLGVLLFW